jgi:hypothetical protein
MKVVGVKPPSLNQSLPDEKCFDGFMEEDLLSLVNEIK